MQGRGGREMIIWAWWRVRWTSKMYTTLASLVLSSWTLYNLIVLSLRGHMAYQVHIVIQMPCKVIVDSICSSAGVSYKLAFRHLVLDVWAAQVHRQHDEGERDYINCICRTQSNTYLVQGVQYKISLIMTNRVLSISLPLAIYCIRTL